VIVLDVIWHGIRDGLLMAYEVWWALVLGFAISAVVQAWVPRARVQASLGGGGPRAVGTATVLGAASSSCSYAAVAIARSLLEKGASVAAALAFQFASTNLVWELGAVLWVLIGWQFTVAEYVGGIVMIALMGVLSRVFVPPDVEAQARRRLAAAAAREPDPGDHCAHHDHDHGDAPDAPPWRERLTSRAAWTEVAGYFVMDWRMVGGEVVLGFAIAGFVAQLPDAAFRAVFLHHAPAPLPAIENAVVGPLIAMASFVCSIGNVPLAAVLWSGGISFGGVIAFLFADLLVLPIIAIYRRAYGRRFTVRIVALMFVTMVVSALVIAGAFHVLGIVPHGPRPSRARVFGSVGLNARLWLDVAAVAVFGALYGLTAAPWRRPRGGAPAVAGAGD
jgi:uncharacterized membrane protein YraQ (UPF0718 family)